MKLRYRAVDYDRVPPTLELTEGEIMGQYRGVNWRCHTLKEVPVPQPSHDLQYRGVAYRSGQTPKQQTPVAVMERTLTAPQTLAAATVGSIQRFNLGREALSELDRVHNTFIRKSLEHRLEVARRRGDQNLIAMLEAEREQLN